MINNPEYQQLKENYDSIVNSKAWQLVIRWYRVKNTLQIIKSRFPQLPTIIKHKILRAIFSSRDLIQLLSISSRHKLIVIQPPSVDWNIPQYQRPQHLATHLSKLGILFLYCTSNQYDNIDGFKKIKKNLYLTNRFDLISKHLNKGWIIIHAGHPNFTIENLVQLKKSGFKLIYDYLDKIDPLISGNNILIPLRHQLINSDIIDLGVASASNLYNELTKNIYPSPTIYLPNGVDYKHFQVNHAKSLIPKDLQPILDLKNPIVGYYGAIAKWLDFPLLNYLAQKNPKLQFVYIGWDYDNSVSKLDMLKNVHYLGIKHYRFLPHYARHFNVAMIPFIKGDIAKSTSPLKLFEYFALGKPVVITSDLNECKPFKGVYVSSTPQEFEHNIFTALKDSTKSKLISDLKEQAKNNSWHKRARDLYLKIKTI